MKKALLMAAALLLAPLAVSAAEYKEGVHYTVINDGPATAKPEITEFFSFYCPHCYSFSKNVVPKILAEKPAGVEFSQTHVDFIGKEMGVEMSRAFAVAHQLNVAQLKKVFALVLFALSAYMLNKGLITLGLY